MRRLWQRLFGMTIRVGLGIDEDQNVRPGTAPRRDVTYRVLCCILYDTEHEKGKDAIFFFFFGQRSPPCFCVLPDW